MICQFKIQLLGISKPPVWRKLQVPDNFSFDRFHLAIQNAFGWDNGHLYSFSPDGYNSEYSIEFPDDMFGGGVTLDPRKTKLKDFFVQEKQTFVYIYGFGDDWTHRITLEKMIAGNLSKPTCVAGKGKCPPEDCGGVWGYEEFLRTIQNKKNPEYGEMREWAGLGKGEEWDVNEFDLEKTNRRVMSERK